jgi:rubrerythrin
LLNAGFEDVHSMKGGIRAWQGAIAEGFPEPAMASIFASARSFDEHVALAWLLEEGTRRFYEEVEKTRSAAEVAGLFHQLAFAEEQHKAALIALYRDLSSGKTAPDFPYAIVGEQPGAVIMEGGVEFAETLRWIRERPLKDLLDFTIALEANAYDRYVVMQRKVADDKAREIFSLLAHEEKLHLERVTRMFETLR